VFSPFYRSFRESPQNLRVAASLPATPVPEFIDSVFVKTSPNRSFSVSENERFGLVFAKSGSINSGTGVTVVASIIALAGFPSSFANLSIHTCYCWGVGMTPYLPYLTFRPARLHRLAESIPCNRFCARMQRPSFGL
jgi:hypothetical protein